MKSFLVAVVMVAAISLCFATDMGLVGGSLVDKQAEAGKNYSVHMYSGGVNVAAYRIKRWDLGFGDKVLSCITIDDKLIIIKGDWIISEDSKDSEE
jgi:hypothetical protein